MKSLNQLTRQVFVDLNTLSLVIITFYRTCYLKFLSVLGNSTLKLCVCVCVLWSSGFFPRCYNKVFHFSYEIPIKLIEFQRNSVDLRCF